jgi:hypothetical protein
MNGATLLMALLTGAALLALWVHVRFPQLAPSGFSARVLAAASAFVLVGTLPVAATVVSLVGFFLPALVFSFLTALWLLQLLADPASHL